MFCDLCWIPGPKKMKTGQHLFVCQKPTGCPACFLQLWEKPLAFRWWIFLKLLSMLKEKVAPQRPPEFPVPLLTWPSLPDFYPPSSFCGFLHVWSKFPLVSSLFQVYVSLFSYIYINLTYVLEEFDRLRKAISCRFSFFLHRCHTSQCVMHESLFSIQHESFLLSK